MTFKKIKTARIAAYAASFIFASMACTAAEISAADKAADVPQTSSQKNAEEAAEILIINQDDSQFFGSLKPENVNKEAALAYIDRFEGSKLSHFFICPNAQRAMFPSKVKMPIWEPQLRPGESPFKGSRWPINVKLFFDRGVDVFSVWIDRCREMGISPWLTMRMNDMHWPDKECYFGHDRIWVERPDLRRVVKRDKGVNSSWAAPALNYKNKEVRDYQLAFIREILERYDCDGLELDWMRFPLHLTPQKGCEEAHILTQFLRDVNKIAREMEAKRGHKIYIGVRVHATVEQCEYVGTDAVTWAKEGLVDMIVPSVMGVSDYDTPVKSWKRVIGQTPKEVKIVPGAEEGTRGGTGKMSCPRCPVDAASLNGFAENAYFNGGDGIYTFNFIYHQKLMVEMAEQGLQEKIVRNLPRRHILSFRDFCEIEKETDREQQVPAKLDEERNLKIQFGRLPDESARGELSVVIGLSNKTKDVKLAAYNVTLNGVASIGVEEEYNLKYYGAGARAIRYFFPYSALKRGYNKVGVVAADDGASSQQYIVWAEIDTYPKNSPRAKTPAPVASSAKTGKKK